jgi:two-component system, response regulator
MVQPSISLWMNESVGMNLPIILMVEDDPNDEELARLAFEEHGVRNQLVVVRDGAEALDYLFGTAKYAGRDLSAMPQLVLLDLKLPKISGLQVLQRLRQDESMKFLPVVIFTSSKEEQDLIDSYKLGANAYVRKPIEFAEFSNAIRQLGLFWVILNLTPPFLRTEPGKGE